MSAVGEGQFGDFLLARFRAFHVEVATLRGQLQAGADDAAHPSPARGRAGAPMDGIEGDEEGEEAGAAAPPSAGPRGMAEAVSQHLADRLRQDSLAAARVGGAYGARLFQEAQYLMAALADEILLHELDWLGRQAWSAVLLESRLFRTHKAGDQVFRAIDELLEGRSRIHGELAMIYLLALKLGFRGRYRHEEDETEVDRYRERLFRFIANRAPNLGDRTRRFFPEPYRNRLGDSPVRHLPHLRRWLMASAAALTVYVALSHLLWHGLATELIAAMHGRL